MTTPCYYLNITIRGYEGEVFLNGAPMTDFNRGYQCVFTRPASEWVLQGENTLSVRVDGGELCDPHVEEAERRARVAAGEEPEEEEATDPGDGGGDDGGDDGDDLDAPVFRVALCEGIVGELVEPGTERELFHLEWTPPPVPTEDEGDPLAFPLELTATGSVSHPWGTWSWEAAPAFDLEEDPGQLVEVIDFLRGLHDALSAGQVQPLVDASAPNYDEVGPCYDIDPADARARMSQAWPEISKPDDFALAEFDESDLDLRPCCEGRLLEPRSFSGQPFLRQAEMIDGALWKMPVFIARLDGDLKIVR